MLPINRYELLYKLQCNTLQECAEKLGVNARTLRRWCANGVSLSTYKKYFGDDYNTLVL